jgi:serine phosphatase RsbU (regulator of sigma subunit)
MARGGCAWVDMTTFLAGWWRRCGRKRGRGGGCFVIGDVAGKDVPAALFMAIVRTLIRTAAETESNPARLLEIVNKRLAENNPNLMFVTLMVGMLHLETRELSWSNAGHPLPLKLLGGTIAIVPCEHV